MKRLTDERMQHMRTAAEVGIRMGGIYPHTVHVAPDELAALLDELAELRGANGPSRCLTNEERRLVVDAVRAAATATRRTKSEAVANPSKAFEVSHSAHIDQLARRAGDLDRLGAELGEHELRLEKLRS